jgi:hypothetical protein
MRPKRSIALPAASLFAAFVSAASLLADPSQQTRLTTPPDVQPAGEGWPDDKTIEDRRKASENRPLFASADTLAITISSDFRAVQRDRDPKSEKLFPATITFTNPDGKSATVPIEIRTRGHSRRLRQTCDFAPLRLEFPKDQVRGTLFEGQGALKLGTHCRGNTLFEQYVLREYTAYRIYNLLTPYSYRARLAKVTYEDPGQKKTETKYGMFIEDDDDVARRMSGRISDAMGLPFRAVHGDTVLMMTLFEYMIGNTDMSMAKQHNVTVVQSRPGIYYTVPYDFDYSGLVDTSYAVADTKQLGIQSVRDRLYRGPCKTAVELEPHFVKLRAAKPDIMALYTALPDMSASYRKDAQKYLEDFYRTIDRPGSAKMAFIDNCDNRPGM